MDKPAISVVLGSFNRKDLLRLALQSVRGSDLQVPYEIIVVDGGSTDGTLKWLMGQKDIITIVQHNRTRIEGRYQSRRSWGYFMNLAFKCAQGKYILMISDDCILHPGAIKAGYRMMEDGGSRLGGCAFYFRNYPDDNRYRVGTTLAGKLFINHGLFLRKAAEEVGWIDEDRYAFYHADTDFCLKLWHHGYELTACEDALVEHLKDRTDVLRESNKASARDNQDRQQYLDRWEGIYFDPGESPQGEWHYLDRTADNAVASAFDPFITSRSSVERLKMWTAATLPHSWLETARQLKRSVSS